MNREFNIISLENAETPLPINGRRQEKQVSDNITLTKIVNDNNTCSSSFYLQQSLSFNKPLAQEVILAVTKCIKSLLKKYNITKRDLCLVVGIGNEGMTADALGAKTLKYLDITEHLFTANVLPSKRGRMAAVASNVSGVTGLQSFDIISGVTASVRPSVIIAVDTLASRTTARLIRVVQISDGGIVPGSGVGNAKQSLTYESIGIPVIAIGVPMVIYARNIIADYIKETADTYVEKKNAARTALNELVVTVKDIDMVVDDYAKVIGQAINKAVHGGFGAF